MGLFSDGGVHSHLGHLYRAPRPREARGARPGRRDRPRLHRRARHRPEGRRAVRPRSFQQQAERIGVGRIGTIVGRYYAMDRDNRWPRTKKAYCLLTASCDSDFASDVFDDPVEALEASYARGRHRRVRRADPHQKARRRSPTATPSSSSTSAPTAPARSRAPSPSPPSTTSSAGRRQPAARPPLRHVHALRRGLRPARSPSPK